MGMSEEQPSGPAAEPRLRVAVLALDTATAHAYVQAVLDGPQPCASGQAVVQGGQVELHTVAAGAGDDREWAAQTAGLSAAVLLARHLDSASLEALGRCERRLRETCGVPLAVFLFRDPGEHEFKISCWECGQKLLADDRDVGKRGRCVRCGRGFRVSTPSEYLRTSLRLPDEVAILVVFRGLVPSCRGALANLLARVAPASATQRPASGRDFLRQATVPIRVERGGLSIGE